MPLIMIVTAFASLVGNGGAPRASIYMGQGNNDYAEKILGNCFITQIIVSIVLYTYSIFLEIVPSYLLLAQAVIQLPMP